MNRARERGGWLSLIAGLLCLLPLAACDLGVGEVDPPRDEAALNVLFVGNSLTYANDLPGIVSALIDSAGAGPAEIAAVAVPNFGLEDHWLSGEARQAIAQGGWDVVVIQQGPSATEGRPSLLEYSERFAAEARAIGADLALYMVWPSLDRFFDFDGVSDSYRTAAENVGGLLFPVGDAWRAAWAADGSLALYGADGFHPSPMGSYLAALVMFGQLTGRPLTELPHAVRTQSGVLVSVDPQTAVVLQAAAAEANLRFGLSP